METSPYFVSCSRREVAGYGPETYPNIHQGNINLTLDSYVNSDCWAIVSGREGHIIVHYNKWMLSSIYSLHNIQEIHFKFYKYEDLTRWDIGDYIDIYLKQYNTKKVRFTKTENNEWSQEYYKEI